ncbi:MAG: hypothetical protein WDZ59_06265 [Pirellulales bacterium]
MWRALFLAVGITCCLLGVEAMAIDKAVLKMESGSQSNPFAIAEAAVSGSREIVPPKWAPWSLISAGAVVILYSFSIPKRVHA